MPGATSLQGSAGCRGRGVAKKCEEAGGNRVDFTEYILDLWKSVGYSPDAPENGHINTINPNNIAQQAGGIFTPKKGPEVVTDFFKGVSIKQFPRGTDQGVIIEFLVNSGLPEHKRNKVSFTSNGGVMIRDLENEECQHLINFIHGKKHFNQKMFCNGFIPLTPEKPTEQALTVFSPEQTLPPLDQDREALPPPSQEPAVHQPDLAAEKLLPEQVEKPLPHFDQGRETLAPPPQAPAVQQSDLLAEKPLPHISSLVDFTELGKFPSDKEVIRRHSISLTDRTPPPNSIAAEIIGKPSSLTAAKSLLAQIADLKESLSDFNSCAESLPESSTTSDDTSDDLEEKTEVKSKNMNEKKREKKRKRKSVQTPNKEDFLRKKANHQKTPQ